jgi:hypothetical protein
LVVSPLNENCRRCDAGDYHSDNALSDIFSNPAIVFSDGKSNASFS